MKSAPRFFPSRLLGAAAAAAAAVSAACVAPRLAEAAERPPNVVMVLTDDQGWMDSAVYGSQYYETPNLDALAARGVRFTDAYSASPLCSPTRISVLTGQFPHRAGWTAPHGHLKAIPVNTPRFRPGQTGAPWQAYLVPESARIVDPATLTYGQVFKDAGYATAFMGKWHLGNAPSIPENFGFDTVIGGRGNPGPPGGFFAPWKSDTLPKKPKGYHIDDALGDEAVAFIDKHKDQPWLLNLWFYNVHAPFQAKADLIKKYERKTDPRGEQGYAIMGAMIETMDENLGRVLDRIDDLGLRGNTVVVFWSDNGGNMYDAVEGSPGPGFPTHNAPLKAGKGNIHEGGIRVPAIIDWPGVTQPGTVSDALVSTIDIFPTLMAMTGVTAPDDAVIDGVSLAPLLRGGDLDRDTTYFHFPHYVPKPFNMSASAVRRGDLKLIRRYDREGTGPDDAAYLYELYDLGEDEGETQNLAGDMPEKVAELDALITKHLEDTGVPVPPANRNFNPTAYNPIMGDGVKPPPPPAPRPVAGWVPSGNTRLAVEGGHLVVTGATKDPWFSTRELPGATGPLVLKLRMKRATTGDAQVFWAAPAKKAFTGAQSVSFNPEPGDGWHEYAVELPTTGKTNGLRIDPARSPGVSTIDWIEVVAPGGDVMKRWDF